MRLLKSAESAGKPQLVTEKMPKGSGRASPNVEDEAIWTFPYPPVSPITETGYISFCRLSEESPMTITRHFSSYPLFDDETYHTLTYPSIEEEVAPLTNEGQIDKLFQMPEMSDEVSNRPQSTENTSIVIKDTNELTSAITLPWKASYAPLAQTNSIGDFVTDESISSGPSTSENEEPDEENALSFSFKKQELLQALMKIFYTQLSPSWRYTAKGFITSVGAAESTRSSGSSAGQESTSPTRGRTERPALKRRADEDSLPPGDGGDEDGRRKRRLKSTPEPQVYSNTRKFACPFFKYDPSRYCSVGSCIGPGFTSVSRVKFVLP
jgi:hypothetical protein